MFLRSLRRWGDSIPVLVITARDAVSERTARARQNGAAITCSRPFDLDELAARIRAVRRRYVGGAEQVLRVASVVEFDPAAHQVARQTARRSPLRARTRAAGSADGAPARRPVAGAAEERVYGWGEEIESNAVELYIHSLRKKLGNAYSHHSRRWLHRFQPADDVHTA